MKGPLWSALPDSWKLGQVKNVAAVTLGKMLQSKNSGSDVHAPYVRAANVQPDGVLALSDSNDMWFGEDELAHLSIQVGDVLVVEGGQGGFGRAAYVDRDLPGWGFQNSINRLRPLHDFDGRFISYYLIALRASGFMHAYSHVVSMPHLTADKLARIPMPLPPPDQQRAISDYLDRETARVDTLIEEQELLTEMLQHRRQAVVEQAVFSGLEGAPTRPHAESWLPPTPTHWGVSQLGFASDTIAGYAFPSDEFTMDRDHIRLLRGVNVKPGRISWTDSVYWNPEPPRIPNEFALEVADVVLGMDRPFVGGGVRVAAISTDDVPALLLQRVMRIRNTEFTTPDYMRYMLSTDAFYTYLEPLFTGVSVPHVSEWQVRKFKMPLPPVEEQKKITSYLDEQVAGINMLLAETERFIDLTRERRAALITAAVTGHIDVREMA